ncbi:DUF5316 domain-containing protein [Peribacillus frigoritolerans]|uniref:DUF5316 family protein n=1 Tax=Peribacillus frigoritolerans TaxID=450367 RepID=UPI0021FC1A92|nr:DUF5316 domain-containing protein [Peribacillus frigoritolerans]
MNVSVCLIVGIVSIVNSGVFIGAWTDGQQQRANFHSEMTKNRSFRTKIDKSQVS